MWNKRPTNVHHYRRKDPEDQETTVVDASIVTPGFYLHKKGDVYKVLGTGLDANNPSKLMVIYRSVIDEKVWIKSVREFTTPGRFTKIKNVFDNCAD